MRPPRATSLASAGTALLIAAAPIGADVSGVARLVSADVLEIGATRVYLHDVRAPDADQSCGSGDRAWTCGQAALDALAARVGASPVVCSADALMQGEQFVGTCRIGSGDGSTINAWLVEQGWALVQPNAAPALIAAELDASGADRGIWRAGFEPPNEWRQPRVKAVPIADVAGTGCDVCSARHASLKRKIDEQAAEAAARKLPSD